MHEAAEWFGLLGPTGGEAPGALDEVERTFDGREDLAQVELARRSRQTVASVPSANRLKDAGSREILEQVGDQRMAQARQLDELSRAHERCATVVSILGLLPSPAHVAEQEDRVVGLP